MYFCRLPNRAVIQISGEDREEFLQGIITNDMTTLNVQPVVFTAMLSSQGKFQHDFFVVKYGDSYLLDTEADHKDALLKKLKLYKMRSKVIIADQDDRFAVYAVWGKHLAEAIMPERSISYLDPRVFGMGMRAIVLAQEQFALDNAEPIDFETYDAHRLELGVPDGWRDATNRNVALELGYDQLEALSTSKGCYIGQEVTARMHHRKILRKCLHQVKTSTAPILPPFGTAITAGDVELGDMRSSRSQQGLAMLRIEETRKAIADGTPIMVGQTQVEVHIPPYMRNKMAVLFPDETQEEVVDKSPEESLSVDNLSQALNQVGSTPSE